jgi:1-acyl-sn-glycerol-3-phosphate acyltransferase
MTYTIAEFYTLIRKKLKVKILESGKIQRVSRSAILRQGNRKILYSGHEKMLSTIECPDEVDRGKLAFSSDKLLFEGKRQNWNFPITEIRGFTTNSKYFEFKVKNKPFFQIYFEHESPLKYQDLFLEWTKLYSENANIIEHQPKIIYTTKPKTRLILDNKKIINRKAREKFRPFEFLLHLFIGIPIVTYMKLRANLTFTNPELIPQHGPFILLMNHESYLDPILISTVSKRRLAFFTKSTSFANRILQPIFKAYRSLPNRRYETDPQVVRHALKVLKTGHCIGIFPEGERTWDGSLIPFKYSTIRFLLSVQVPIVIAKISGAFDLLPRWSHKIRKGSIAINIMKSFSISPGKWSVEELKDELENLYR